MQGFKIGLTVLFASLLIVGSSLIQGVDVGLRAPVSGDAQERHFRAVLDRRTGILARRKDVSPIRSTFLVITTRSSRRCTSTLTRIRREPC